MARLAIDPVTRVGGNLRVEVEVDGGAVSNAWSSGTSFRGIELVLQGRDPRDAWLFADRVCGSCSTVHALASVRAVENALKISIPTNARIIRNIIAGARYAQSHVTQFYHQQAFDWVDITAATRADPAATATLARSLSDWPKSDAAYFPSARARLAAVVQSGQLGPFASDAAGHPAYTASPETSLLILAHYLEALDWRRVTTRIQAMLGGKSPHPQTFLVGGMAVAPEWTGPARPPGEHPWGAERISPRALTANGLSDLAALLDGARTFVEETYLPDVVRVGRAYPEWTDIGTGIGNYLSFGDFPADDSTNPALLLPRGRVMADDASKLLDGDPSGVAETVAHSYYEDAALAENGGLRSPADGVTSPRFAGPMTANQPLARLDRYSWVKAPRFRDDPVEVGPLARTVIGLTAGSSRLATELDGVLERVGIGRDRLGGTIGRTVARAVEAQMVAEALPGWLEALGSNLGGDLAIADVTKWNPATWPAAAQGTAIGESPRGAVGHWVTLDGRWVRGYQIVDATTWNASPRDARGRPGALERALVGTPVSDPDRPLEVLRTVHAFDLCPACAVHTFDPGIGGRDLVEVRLMEEARG